MCTRRHLLALAVSALALTLGNGAPAAGQPAGDEGNGTLVFVGTYTGAKTTSKGIYAFRLRRSGAGAPSLEPLGLAADAPSPSFLTIDRERDLLFAVNETDTFDGGPTGSVSAYSIDRKTGRLTLINRQPSLGRAPCHLTLDREGRNLIVANYSSGTVAVLPVAADGRLGEGKAVQHSGSSVNPQRQKGPHAHCTTFDPQYRFLFACDLGIDRVMVYRLDAAGGTLTPHASPFVPVTPGSGPRHMDFRPDARFAYVLNELTSSVTAFAFDAAQGTLAEVETVSTLPAGHAGANSGAEIAVHPSGRFLYTSNRGHDSIARFRIDQHTGRLTLEGTTPTGGRTPRHFALDPSGSLLVAANQDSGSLVLFSVDAETGALAPLGSSVATPSPVCVAFLPARR